MYNLTVDEAHTFFVGDGAWLVHNTNGPCDIPENALGNLGNDADAIVHNLDTLENYEIGHHSVFSGVYDNNTKKWLAYPTSARLC
jgi:hypothetical protein